jgi:hypothetical protein
MNALKLTIAAVISGTMQTALIASFGIHKAVDPAKVSSQTHASRSADTPCTSTGMQTFHDDAPIAGSTNVAPHAAPDAVFWSPNGSDANSGLDYGHPKATLAGAFGACTGPACTIRAGDGNAAIGTFDPGSKAVVLHLGHGTYSVTQITIENNLHIIGEGSNSLNGTLLVQATRQTAPFVISQSRPVAGVKLAGFRLDAASASTSSGFDVEAPAYGGLWYSEIDDVQIGASVQFGADALRIVGGGKSGINQFDTFQRVIAFRKNGGSGKALDIIGFNNSLKFNNCEFDGALVRKGGDGGINIYVGDSPGAVFPPYNIQFDLLTTQWAGVAMQINGVDALLVINPHLEGDWGEFNVGMGASFGSIGVSVIGGGAYNGSGQHRGTGYVVEMAAATPNASVTITGFHSYDTPDAFLTGNTGAVWSAGNIVGPEGQYTFYPMQFPAGNDGFGNGTPGRTVTTTTLGTGTGPSNPQTIVRYEKIRLGNGVTYWVPLMQ